MIKSHDLKSEEIPKALRTSGLVMSKNRGMKLSEKEESEIQLKHKLLQLE